MTDNRVTFIGRPFTDQEFQSLMLVPGEENSIDIPFEMKLRFDKGSFETELDLYFDYVTKWLHECSDRMVDRYGRTNKDYLSELNSDREIVIRFVNGINIGLCDDKEENE